MLSIGRIRRTVFPRVSRLIRWGIPVAALVFLFIKWTDDGTGDSLSSSLSWLTGGDGTTDTREAAKKAPPKGPPKRGGVKEPSVPGPAPARAASRKRRQGIMSREDIASEMDLQEQEQKSAKAGAKKKKGKDWTIVKTTYGAQLGDLSVDSETDDATLVADSEQEGDGDLGIVSKSKKKPVAKGKKELGASSKKKKTSVVDTSDASSSSSSSSAKKKAVDKAGTAKKDVGAKKKPAAKPAKKKKAAPTEDNAEPEAPPAPAPPAPAKGAKGGEAKVKPGKWQDVAPMIGTGAHGNVWVGAGSPHGLAKLTIDTRQSRPGYSAWKPITGTSFVHVSGTGGPESYQVPTVFTVITFGAKSSGGAAALATAPPEEGEKTEEQQPEEEEQGRPERRKRQRPDTGAPGQPSSGNPPPDANPATPPPPPPGSSSIPAWFEPFKQRHSGSFKSPYHPPKPPPGYAMPDAPPESANKMPPDEGKACCTRISLWSGRREENVSVGYYAVTIDEMDTRVEMAANGKVGIERYTYVGKPDKYDDGMMTLVIDISKHSTEDRHFKNGKAKVLLVADKSPDARPGSKKLRIQGGGTYTDGWAEGLGTAGAPHGQYQIHWCGEVDAIPAFVGSWDGSSISTDDGKIKGAMTSGSESEEDVTLLEIDRSNQHVGVLLSFPLADLPRRKPSNWTGKAGPQIELRLGLSGKSVEAACRNYQESIFGHPEEKAGSFEAAVVATRKEWDNILSSVEIDASASKSLKAQFYSALYRSFLMPTNYTGDEPARWGINEQTHIDYFTDFYTLWDIFRTQLPLVTLLRPATGAAIVRSLISIYQAEGYLPDSRVGAWNGLTQLGSNGDCVLADAVVKGLDLTDDERKLAFEAARKDAEEEPGNWFLMGRGGLSHWKTIGYIPVEGLAPYLARFCGRTLEYSYNDYCVSLLAEAIGKKDDAKLYLNRSANWRNLWNAEVSSMGSSGFIMGKTPDGKWAQGRWTDPTYCAPGTKEYATCYLWQSWFYESSSWTYSFYAPHDMAALVKLSGGKEAFVKRLDTFFSNASKMYDPSNEPSFLIPFAYIYAGRPDRSIDTIRQIVSEHYSAAPDGLPGNDDAGAMSAWLAFALLGYYPVAGQDVYLLTSPFFKTTVIHSIDESTGKKRSFKVVAYNLSPSAIYVKSAKLNGQVLTRSWFRHTEIWGGPTSTAKLTDAVLELWMADKPGKLGTRDADLPPSRPVDLK